MIHRIRIRNYKSLRDVTVDLSPVTVFIGKSGTGKSNFAAAIQFLRDCLVYAGQGQLPQQYVACKCATNSSEGIEFKVEFDVPGFDQRFSYVVHLSERNVAEPPRLESLQYGTDTVFRQERKESQAPKWTKQPPLVVPPQPGPIALGRLPGLEEAVVAFTALTAGIGIYAFPFHVFTISSDSAGTSGLADDGSNFLHVLKDIASSLQKIETRKGIAAALRQINPTIDSVNLDSIQNPQTAFVGHRLGDKILTLQLRQESDGLRRFYAHLLALYQTPPKQTLVFEEPENGIYPGALALLADEFKAAPEAGRGQVLITTHSPSLLDRFSTEQIRVVELVDLETKIGPLAEEQRDALADDLLHAGELLTVDPARRQGE